LVSLLQQKRTGILAQTYYPVNSPAWNTIISAKNANPSCPIAVVITIEIAKDESLINRLRDAGIIVLGWVDTNYATIPEEDVRKAIDAWHSSSYPQIDGIFFQSMSNQTAFQSYYDNLHNYARTVKGFSTTCANAKTTVPTGFLNGGTTDVVIVWDGSGLDVVDSTYSQYNIMENNTLGVSAFSAPVLDASWILQMSQYVGWVYMTPDTGAAPYDTLPSYFTEMVELLADKNKDVSTRAPIGAIARAVPDQFGVNKIYHTKAGGQEFFTNQNDLLADASTNGRIQNFEGENIVKQSDGSYSSNGGDNGDLRLEIWSPALSNTTDRLAACWRNVEMTVYFKYMSQDGSNPPYVCQLYMKGGHHSSTENPCEGAAYKFRVDRVDPFTSYDKELCHSNYAGNSNEVTVPGLSSNFANGQWHGFKAVQWTDGGAVRLQTWIDLNCSDSNGNLVLKNNWQMVNSRSDTGGWECDSAPADCNGCGRPSMSMIMTGPMEVVDSGSPNYRRNLSAYRSDNVTTRFRYMSVREIDPTQRADDTTTPPPPPPPSSTTDPFGVKKIYPTATNGFENYMPSTPATDTTTWAAIPSAGITTNSDGSFKMTTTADQTVHATECRLSMFQRNGYVSTTAQTNAQNHAQLHAQGWMQSSTDFRNVEMTAYYKINTAPATGNFEFTARGGRHIDPSPNAEGTALRAHLSNTGVLQFGKEQYHSSTAPDTPISGVTTSLVGRWVGMKYVVANKVINGTLVTKQEFWLDNAANNTWAKVGEKVDAGGWGSQGDEFGGAPDQLISWGGPACIFWWTQFTNVDFKWLSVRELDPAGIPIEAEPEEPPSHCGSSSTA
jgi:hypothetical protein